MEDSILNTIRKMVIGEIPINSDDPEETQAYNTDLIIHINTAFATLAQLGAGPKGGFFITDATATWSDFFAGAEFKPDIAEMVKTYIYLKVRLIFDPPTNSSAVEQMNKQASECEWRICEGYEPAYGGT
jgi:hypothetical protein